VPSAKQNAGEARETVDPVTESMPEDKTLPVTGLVQWESKHHKHEIIHEKHMVSSFQ
jgi:hypothetical protein